MSLTEVRSASVGLHADLGITSLVGAKVQLAGPGVHSHASETDLIRARENAENELVGFGGELRRGAGIAASYNLSQIHIGLLEKSKRFAKQRLDTCPVAALPSQQRVACSLNQLSISGFCNRGWRNLMQGKICEDNVGVSQRQEPGNQFAVISVNDGISKAGLFASRAARYLGLVIAESALYHSRNRNALTSTVLDPNFLGVIHADACMAFYRLAAVLNCSVEDVAQQVLQTTTTNMVITPYETLVFGLGDGFMRRGDVFQAVKHRHIEGSHEFTQATKRGVPPPKLASVFLNKLAAGVVERRVLELCAAEAAAFDIYLYKPTVALLETSLGLFSDGARCCQANGIAHHNHQSEANYFPIARVLRNKLGAQNLV